MFFTDYLYPLFSSLDENLSPGRILRYGKLFLFMCFITNLNQSSSNHLPDYANVARTCNNPTPSDPSGTGCSFLPTPFKPSSDLSQVLSLHDQPVLPVDNNKKYSPAWCKIHYNNDGTRNCVDYPKLFSYFPDDE